MWRLPLLPHSEVNDRSSKTHPLHRQETTMFIHPEISRELTHGRQREMLAYAQHRRLKNMLTAARTERPRITGPGAHQVSLRLLGEA